MEGLMILLVGLIQLIGAIAGTPTHTKHQEPVPIQVPADKAPQPEPPVEGQS